MPGVYNDGNNDLYIGYLVGQVDEDGDYIIRNHLTFDIVVSEVEDKKNTFDVLQVEINPQR